MCSCGDLQALMKENGLNPFLWLKWEKFRNYREQNQCNITSKHRWRGISAVQIHFCQMGNKKKLIT